MPLAPSAQWTGLHQYTQAPPATGRRQQGGAAAGRCTCHLWCALVSGPLDVGVQRGQEGGVQLVQAPTHRLLHHRCGAALWLRDICSAVQCGAAGQAAGSRGRVWREGRVWGCAAVQQCSAAQGLAHYHSGLHRCLQCPTAPVTYEAAAPTKMSREMSPISCSTSRALASTCSSTAQSDGGGAGGGAGGRQ